MIGRDIEEAVSLAMSLGPAGEIIRLAGDRAAHLHEPIDTALREGLAVYQDADGQHPRTRLRLDRDGDRDEHVTRRG